MSQTVSLTPVPRIQFLDVNGIPLAGGLIYTYAADTTTPQATYTDGTGTTQNPNPVVLDSGGFASIWLVRGQYYKLVAESSSNVSQWTQDNVGDLVNSILNANGYISNALTSYELTTVSRTYQDKLSDFINVRDFGATGNGTTDDTAAFQAAMTYLSGIGGGTLWVRSGIYKISNSITIPANTRIVGEGMWNTQLTIASTFPLTATGVLIGTAGIGPIIEDLNISFIQPDSTTLSSYTQWPVAINLAGCTRSTVRNVGLWLAWDGIALTTAGGSLIDNVHMSCFGAYHINIDAAYDSVYIKNTRCYPYNCTANQMTCYENATTLIGLNCGRCDDLQVTDFFALGQGTGINVYASANGATNGNLEGVWLDGTSLIVTNGILNISNLTLGSQLLTASALQVSGNVSPIVPASSGTMVNIVNSFLSIGGTAPTQNLVYQTGGILKFSNCYFLTLGYDVGSIYNSGGDLTVIGCRFDRNSNTSYVNSTITAAGSGSRVTLVGNRALDKGTGTGSFINVGTDNWNVVRANVAPSWGFTFPTSITEGQYEGPTTTISFTGVSSLPNGGQTTAVYAVAGAVLGQFVKVAAPYTLQGLVVEAYVSSAGNVTIVFFNQTGSSVTLASGTWNVKVWS